MIRFWRAEFFQIFDRMSNKAEEEVLMFDDIVDCRHCSEESIMFRNLLTPSHKFS